MAPSEQIAAQMTKHPAYAAMFVFVALVTLSSWQTTPHIVYAGETFELGSTSQGTVQIRISNWSGSDKYHTQGWRKDTQFFMVHRFPGSH